jgi:hypothetical protein
VRGDGKTEGKKETRKVVNDIQKSSCISTAYSY